MAPHTYRAALITGYVPISGHPRAAKEYGDLGEKIFPHLDCVGGDFYIAPFYETLPEAWLWKKINNETQMLGRLSHSAGDNPQKNTLAYHIVQHQKFGWLMKAALKCPPAETYVWMDYGIGHVPGVTPAVVNRFMSELKPNDFAIPGCWEREGLVINDYFPCWRFCGGLMVVPRNRVYKLYKFMKDEVMKHLKKTHNLTWEVNSLAAIEPQLPDLRWYKADHNQTMFTEYYNGQVSQGAIPGAVNTAVSAPDH